MLAKRKTFEGILLGGLRSLLNNPRVKRVGKERESPLKWAAGKDAFGCEMRQS